MQFEPTPPQDDDLVRGMRRALDEGELERDLMLEVAAQRLAEVDDEWLWGAVGTLLGEVHERVSSLGLEGSALCVRIADLAIAEIWSRFVPEETVVEAYRMAEESSDGLDGGLAPSDSAVAVAAEHAAAERDVEKRRQLAAEIAELGEAEERRSERLAEIQERLNDLVGRLAALQKRID